MRENLEGNSCGKILWEILVGKSCLKFLWENFAGNAVDNLVGNLARKSSQKVLMVCNRSKNGKTLPT